MGWTATRKTPGMTAAAFVQEKCWPATWLAESGQEVVATAETAGAVFIALKLPGTNGGWLYDAYKAKRGEPITVAIVALVEDGAGPYGFRFKTMDETMGPYAPPAPQAFLEKLTPLNLENVKPEPNYCPIRGANNWRTQEAA